VALRLADGSTSMADLPIYANADLASGRVLDLGSFLLVRTGKTEAEARVIRASGTIKTVTSR
jgi:hypothetical protein